MPSYATQTTEVPRRYATLSLRVHDEEDPIPVGIVVFLPQGIDVPIARESRHLVLDAYPGTPTQELFAKLPKLLVDVAGEGSIEERYQRLQSDPGVALGPLQTLNAPNTQSYERTIARTLSNEVRRLTEDHQRASFAPFQPLTYMPGM